MRSFTWDDPWDSYPWEAASGSGGGPKGGFKSISVTPQARAQQEIKAIKGPQPMMRVPSVKPIRRL